MKCILFFLTVFFMGFISSASALTVNLLDSNYTYDLSQVVSYNNVETDEWGTYERTMTGSSDNAFSQTLYILSGSYSVASASPFTVYADSSSYHYPEDVLPNCPECHVEYSCYGHAVVEADWIFQPVGSESGLNLLFDSGGDWTFTAGFVSLIDIADGVEIVSFRYNGLLVNIPPSWPDEEYYWPDWDSDEYLLNIDYRFEENHTYQLKLGAYADSDDDDFDLRVTADMVTEPIAPIPEPIPLFLLGAGYLLLLISRYDFIKTKAIKTLSLSAARSGFCR